MFDPLNSSTSPWGQEDTPPWPTTPHVPNSPIPNLRPASATASAPPTPDKGPSPGLYGKEPQIYGQPETGLISPRETVSSNGTNFEKPEPYLRVKVTGLDRNRRDILIKLDAQTNLSNFTGTTYRNVSRSYYEFQQFYEAIVHSNPHTIVPALPLAQTSAPTDEEDDRLFTMRIFALSSKVTLDTNPYLVQDGKRPLVLASFEDMSQTKTKSFKKQDSSSQSWMDNSLKRQKLWISWQLHENATLAVAHSEMGNKLLNVATTEAHPPLGNALRKLGRTWHSLADLDQAQSISECVILGDSLGYQGMNARSAKETLQMRTGVLEEYQAAVKTTISKRRQIERLKASSNIRPERVDEALEEIEEASKYEQVLAKRAEGISQNLHRSLETHNRYANDDITAALIEHARSSIMYERQLLRELEALRADVSNADKKAVPVMDGAPKPTIIPPLEDFSRPPLPPASAPAPVSNGYHPPPPRIQTQPIPQQPSLPYNPNDPLSDSYQPHKSAPARGPLPPSTISPSLSQSSFQRQQVSNVPAAAREAYARSQLSSSTPSSPMQSQFLPPQSPGAGPSSPSPAPSRPIDDGPPLGGRFVDGTKSMFVKPPSSPLASGTQSPSKPASSYTDPLLGSTPVRPSSAFDTNRGISGLPPQSNGLDPLGQARPINMSSSVRIQPTRPRLDAREAASKLANMF
ncbi:hypothetical protein D9758_004814 [Tetrapyrgos nigripes]|uniref:Sorting nexin/Vps5-like C-terminal domain-containing protein n=1 Tax=Tetrapyrgos nigripes TaxID=182062 RepID=A0A8H5G616_9AGAR|nr:hypothetical protein D9758_004814 [Tetrapyrgos nigripes]